MKLLHGPGKRWAEIRSYDDPGSGPAHLKPSSVRPVPDVRASRHLTEGTHYHSGR
jgi:hypothetical protein